MVNLNIFNLLFKISGKVEKNTSNLEKIINTEKKYDSKNHLVKETIYSNGIKTQEIKYNLKEKCKRVINYDKNGNIKWPILTYNSHNSHIIKEEYLDNVSEFYNNGNIKSYKNKIVQIEYYKSGNLKLKKNLSFNTYTKYYDDKNHTIKEERDAENIKKYNTRGNLIKIIPLKQKTNL